MTDGHVWVGADPGGKDNFGVAVLEEGGASETRCVDCAEDAVKFVILKLHARTPTGVGVDAPLWWSSGRSSDRAADRWLRQRYRLSGGEVQTANSLKGAALVQAAMFIERLRQAVGQLLPVTEVHPKALLKGVSSGDWAVFCARFDIPVGTPREHERDAIIAAIAAREGFGGRWSNDLSLRRLPEEQDPRSYWLAPVHYFWPEV